MIAAGAVALAAVALLVSIGRDGGAAGAAGGAGPVRLAWQGEPRLIDVPELPGDRILAGTIRNTSLRPVDLDVERVEIVDARGRRLKSSARFLAAFAHGLYPPSQRTRPPGRFERTRLGEMATVEPGQTLPLTLSWRVPPGAAAPTEVRFGGGSLRLPD